MHNCVKVPLAAVPFSQHLVSSTTAESPAVIRSRRQVVVMLIAVIFFFFACLLPFKVTTTDALTHRAG